MTKQEPSEGAMRAAVHRGLFKSGAARGFDYGSIDGEVIDAIMEELTSIIDKHTRQNWIKCSERMPTREDGDKKGRVLVWHPQHGKDVTRWDEMGLFVSGGFTHWLSLPTGPEEK